MNSEQMALAEEFRRAEMGRESATDRAWAKWLAAAEKLAVSVGGFRTDFHPVSGSPLDGDEPSGDCYSIDSAYEAWDRGQTPAQYIGACAHRMMLARS